MTIKQGDEKRLQREAEILRDDLRYEKGAANVRWRTSLCCKPTSTDGWRVELGVVGQRWPRLELWLDRWPLRTTRDFYFGFYSPHRQIIQRLIRRLPEELAPVCTLANADYERTGGGIWLLKEPLSRRNFNQPIYESYDACRYFFGIYHPTHDSTTRGEGMAARRGAAFFLEVLGCLPCPRQGVGFVVYPKSENRQVVVQHLNRERSSLLAEGCKIRDKYRCQVCLQTLEELYGELGRGFAEAHHKVPLSQLKRAVKNTVNDLITVCPNCHRMLHRMEGGTGDIPRLRRIVSQRRRYR